MNSTHITPSQVLVDVICNPVEVRRCRFMETIPLAVFDNPPRLAPEAPAPRPKLDSSELECERGLVVEEASFGNVFAPFRAVPLGVPDARFLR